jgi:three-Cys-motif partner protein
MFDARPMQTKVKHIILEQYIKAWGGIITFGTRRAIHRARENNYASGLHFVYVDCFAGPGRYEGELEDKQRNKRLEPVSGSPLIGIQALDSLVQTGNKQGISIHTNTILIEEKKNTFEDLKTSLEVAGYTARTRETRDFQRLKAGEIAIICADSTSLVSDLLAYTTRGKYTYAFYLLDPFGPTGIPLTNVSQIIRQKRHDTLINMPYQDLHKKSGIVGKFSPSSAEATILNNYDAMFGDSNWHNIVERWQQTAPELRQSEELELELATYYRDVLNQVDTSLSVKSIPLRFSDKERTMFHLYLTTHDPNGALKMNEIMLNAGYAENHLRWQLHYTKLSKGGQQLDLFAQDEIPPPINKPDRNYTDEIARKIATAFTGKTTNRRQIYHQLADDLYLPGEITKALSKLKKEEKANFDGAASKLTNKAKILVH